MPDSRIIDYLRLNQGKYPLEALKAALVKQGFPEADVEEAARQASGAPGVPPPPGPEFGTDAPADRVVFGFGAALANAKAMLSGPDAFFARLDPGAPFKGPVLAIAFWGLVSGVLTFLLSFVRPSPFGVIAAALQIVLLPIMAVLLSWLGAGVFHVMCLLLGGTAPYAVSYQVIAAMAALFPVSTALSLAPYGVIPVQLVGLWLSVSAAQAAHGVGKTKAWVLFGLLTAFGVIGSILAQAGLREYERGAGMGMNAAGAPQGIPPEAAEAMAQLGGQMTPEAQKMMTEAMQNPAAILQELTKFGNMAEPPQATLALLDSEGQARLAKSWTTMSAPMRQSLVQTLPNVPAAERNGFMDQMDAYTKDMNATMNQSMKLIEQAQKQMGQTK
ncbi:YIP1 family protein [bacterium]|nr:MAG: YIP1 family protein [bacterium]